MIEGLRQHVRALANECRTMARALRCGSVLAAVTCLYSVYADAPQWAIVMAGFAILMEFMGATCRRDHKALSKLADRYES
jgi:hypothetical protein